MSAPESYKSAAFLDQPSGSDIMIVQADENGRRIEGDLRVAADNSLQRQRIAMVMVSAIQASAVAKPSASRLVLLGESLDHRTIVERVAALG